ncbi:hypothetical protein ACRDU6_14760 [Mycolicibacterium sp. ELW1]|uniref:hypothetical protein n=1 Tax=Mycobacteriaceae TaxID=1762 RepID=UPI0011ED880B|nr:hypothetical protein [Mycobacterium sp. ELW1]QEN13760.1 hypothetical protein D3H54_11330 [Mycobacterium sp. ELW1]
MTEMLAALLGALVGGLLAAWVGSRQTAKVLKHETDLAATERRETQRLDEERRRTFAADQLIAALADFTTVNRDDERDPSASFVRIATTVDVHRERNGRAAALLEAGSSHAHALPPELRDRWGALIWMVRFNQSKQSERSEELRWRDAQDLLNYIEYVRRSLSAVGGDYPMPPHFSAPDARREGTRPWGFEPEEGCDEPDLTEWHLSSRLVGQVKFSSGDVRWYGPNGLVVDVPQESTDTSPSDQ